MTKREIEQMKSSVCIKEVVEGYVSLERKGSNYMGLCPFHEDHHPSLIVNPEKQTFHCFACGEHGDALLCRRWNIAVLWRRWESLI